MYKVLENLEFHACKFLENNIKTGTIKAISLDLFENLFELDKDFNSTILFQVAQTYLSKHPKCIFDPYDIVNMREIAEKKIFISKSLNHEPITLDDIYSCINLPKDVLIELKTLEIETIKINTTPSPTLKILIKKINELKEKFIFKTILISDTYYPESLVNFLLIKHYPEIRFEKCYLSSNYNKTKSSGKLYSELIYDNRIKYSELIHIGKSIQFDYKVAYSLGIKSILLTLNNNEKSILNREKYFVDKIPNNKLNLSRTDAVICRPLELDDKESTFYYNMGAFIFGPILIEFCRWVADKCLQSGITKILSFAREGILFNKIFKCIFESESKYKSLSANVLYASRKSTNYEVIINGIKNNFEEQIQYALENNFSVYELLENICIFDYDKSIFQDLQLCEFIKKYDQSTDQYLNLKSTIAKALSNRNNIIQEKLNLIKEYVSKLSNKEQYAFVDLGGGGSIAKNLNSITNSKSSASFLLFQTKNSLDDQNGWMSKTLFSTFLPYEGLNRYPIVIESLLMGTIGSTEWYSKKDGNVIPKFAKYFTYTKSREKIIDSFEKGVLHYYLISKENYDSSKNLSTDDRLYLSSIISRLCLCPTKDEVEYLGSLPHDENDIKHENSHYLVPCNAFANMHVKSCGITDFFLDFKAKGPEYFRKRVNKLYWPAGTVTQLNEDFCDIVYGNKHTENYLYVLIERLFKKESLNTISVYGSAEICEKIIFYSLLNGINIKKIYDKKALSGNFKKYGFTVEPLTFNSVDDDDSIVIASLGSVDEIQDFIKNMLEGKKYKVYSLTYR